MDKKRNKSAALRECLRCHKNGRAVPKWAAAALAPMLRAELNKLKRREVMKVSKKENRKGIKMLARWATFTMFRRYGATRDEAFQLAAQALGKSFGGRSTVEHGYKDFRKWFGLPPGALALPTIRGAESMDLTDLAGVPDEQFLKKRWDTFVSFKNHGSTRDDALARTVAAFGDSLVEVPDERFLDTLL